MCDRNSLRRNCGRKCFGNIFLLRYYGRKGISAAIASYGRKYPVSVSSVPPKSRMCFQMTHIELKSVAEKCLLQPKMSVTAENSYFRSKIPYGRNFGYGISEKILFRSHTTCRRPILITKMLHIFGYGRISAFIELYVSVTEFRKKSSFGHTLHVEDRYWLLKCYTFLA